MFGLVFGMAAAGTVEFAEQFSISSGIFASRKLPLRDILAATAIFLNGAEGPAVEPVARILAAPSFVINPQGLVSAPQGLQSFSRFHVARCRPTPCN